MVELHSSLCCHITLLPIVIQKQRIVLRKRSLSKQVSVWGAKIYILVTTPMTHAGKLFGEEFFRNVRDSSTPTFCCRLYIATSPGWQIRRLIKRKAQSALIYILLLNSKTTVPFLIENPLWKTVRQRLPDYYQC